MNFLRNVRSSLSGWLPRRDAIKETPTGLGDIYFELMVETLSWNTRYTLHTLIFWLGFHMLLFLTGLNTLGCFFFALMIFFIIDYLYRPAFESQYTGRYSDDFRRLKQGCINSFASMRHEGAVLFYPVISALLWSLMVVSAQVSGLGLSVCFVLVLYFSPLLVKRLPKALYDCLAGCYRSLGASNSVPEHELFPYWMEKERDAGIESLAIERTADSFTASMPSYLEVAETSKVIQEEDLLPHPSTGHKSGISFTPSELSSSDSESEIKGIQFESHHFNSSSSDEERFLVQTTANKHVERTESDSEFDIIDSDEACVVQECWTFPNNCNVFPLAYILSQAM